MSYEEHQSLFEAYGQSLGRTPVVNHVVLSAGECPFDNPRSDFNDCSKYCSSGKRELHRFGDEVRNVYDVSACVNKQRYDYLLGKSGLQGIQLEHSFEKADINSFNKEIYAELQKWDYRAGKGIYITSTKDAKRNPQGNGTGKTYALDALAHKLCREGTGCLFSTTTQFFSELKTTYDEFAAENERAVLDRYINIPVLLWDDLGKENFNKSKDWTPSTLLHVVNERVTRKKPIVISSNFTIEELEDRFGIENYGPAISSRLGEHCVFYFLGGPDRRLERRG